MPQPETYSFEDTGWIPNSRLPVLVYREVDNAHAPSDCKQLFARNQWLGAWVDGIFPFHRFHSTAHEVLGVVEGSGSIVLGGPGGQHVEVAAGDVVVLPAGTGHCNGGSASDFVVVGAYPEGMSWDLCQGDPREHDEVLVNIEAVPLPGTDPVHGADGPLIAIWHVGSTAS
jgi:uncharacterized protein YjlB